MCLDVFGMGCFVGAGEATVDTTQRAACMKLDVLSESLLALEELVTVLEITAVGALDLQEVIDALHAQGRVGIVHIDAWNRGRIDYHKCTYHKYKGIIRRIIKGY